jgi:hypothetical protein
MLKASPTVLFLADRLNPRPKAEFPKSSYPLDGEMRRINKHLSSDMEYTIVRRRH